MSIRLRRKIFPRLRRRRRSIPPQRPRCPLRSQSAAREQLHGLGSKNRSSSAQHRVSELGQIFRVREQPSLGGYSTQNAGVFVLHFPLDDAMPERFIVCRWGDLRLNFCRGIKLRVRHTQRRENFPLAKAIQRLVSQPLQGYPEQYESNVAVFSPHPGIGGEPRRKNSAQKFLAAARPQKQLFVRGQPRTVSQQHPHGHFMSSRIFFRIGNKLGNNRRNWRVEVKQPALVKQHRHRRCGNDFRERSQIKQSCRRSLNPRIVGEAAERSERDQFFAVRNRDRRRGKRPLPNGFPQNGKGGSENLVLAIQATAQQAIWFSRGQGNRAFLNYLPSPVYIRASREGKDAPDHADVGTATLGCPSNRSSTIFVARHHFWGLI
jgi:hypothetical protein